MNPEQEQEIRSLRSQSLTPKQIARKLGLKVSQVSAVIKAIAEQTTLERAASGELAPIAQCLVNNICAKKLLESNNFDDGELDVNGVGGLGLVSVARSTGYERFVVCNYLIDYWCLGLKDTLGPRQLNGSSKYQQFVQASYLQFPDSYQEISLEQAQAIVLGVVSYANQLGFSPHRGFDQTQTHLGNWSGQPQLKFGRNGKPFYINGPYDNARQIVEILRKNVGEGNFDYVVGMG